VGREEHSNGSHVLLKQLLFILQEQKLRFNFNASCVEPRLNLKNKENSFAVRIVVTGYISVLPEGQHKSPYQLLSFTASVWNAIRPCQVAMNNN
jgi:hypothetical protein